MNEIATAKAYFSTREIADSLGEKVNNVRLMAFRLFPRSEIELRNNEFVFSAEQAAEIEAVFRKESTGKSNVLAVPEAKDSAVSAESGQWYTIGQLAELSGLSVETLKKGDSPLTRLSLDFKDETRLGGYHNTQKFYSKNVLKALQMYLIKNGTSNAMKNKPQVQENIVRGVSELTYESTVEQIKRSFAEGYEMLSDATKEMIARDIKIGMQSEYIREAKPKADYFDAICGSANLTEIGTVGKSVGIGSQKFFGVLTGDKVIRKRLVDGVGFYEPYYGYEKYFRAVPVPFEKDGKPLTRNKLMFNAAGVVWATRRYGLQEDKNKGK